MERMTFSTHLHVEFLARIRVTSSDKDRFVSFNQPLHHGTGRPFDLTPVFLNQIRKLFVAMNRDAANRIEGKRRRGNFASIDRIHQLDRPRFTTDEQRLGNTSNVFIVVAVLSQNRL